MADTKKFDFVLKKNCNFQKFPIKKRTEGIVAKLFMVVTYE